MEIEHDDGYFKQYPKLNQLLKALVQIRLEKESRRLPCHTLPTEKANPRILIFGTGEAGKGFYQVFNREFQVLAFVDNDKKKQGTLLNNLPVISPEDIYNFSFDEIYIASQFYPQIYQQIAYELAVPAFRIKNYRDLLGSN